MSTWPRIQRWSYYTQTRIPWYNPWVPLVIILLFWLEDEGLERIRLNSSGICLKTVTTCTIVETSLLLRLVWVEQNSYIQKVIRDNNRFTNTRGFCTYNLGIGSYTTTNLDPGHPPLIPIYLRTPIHGNTRHCGLSNEGTRERYVCVAPFRYPRASLYPDQH